MKAQDIHRTCDTASLNHAIGANRLIRIQADVLVVAVLALCSMSVGAVGATIIAGWHHLV